MAKKTEPVLDTCPPLPAGPVDFDVLEAAIAAGKNAAQVILAVQGLPDGAETPAPAPEPAAAPDPEPFAAPGE